VPHAVATEHMTRIGSVGTLDSQGKSTICFSEGQICLQPGRHKTQEDTPTIIFHRLGRSANRFFHPRFAHTNTEDISWRKTRLPKGTMLLPIKILITEKFPIAVPQCGDQRAAFVTEKICRRGAIETCCNGFATAQRAIPDVGETRQGLRLRKLMRRAFPLRAHRIEGRRLLTSTQRTNDRRGDSYYESDAGWTIFRSAAFVRRAIRWFL